MSSSQFEAFWAAFPKKEGKAACIKKWEQKHLDDQSLLIVEHVKRRAKEDKKWKDGFIPMPLTFLNQERWTDEYEKIQFKQPVSTQQADLSAPVYPQPCHWQATANGVLMLVLQSVGGVPRETLVELVAMKRKMGERLRTLYGDNEAPAEDWRRISKEAFDWMSKVARGTSGKAGSGAGSASEDQSVAVTA
jgi:hypothetical protein